VPKDLVEKQYGKTVEVTKVVDLALERFTIRKIKPLGTPLPKVNEHFMLKN
jgi:hypothetical protein